MASNCFAGHHQLKIVGIVLAAGLSHRMGTIKALLPWGQSFLLDRVIANACRSQLDSLIVVLGHEAKSIIKKIDFKDSKVIINPDYTEGQSSSLKAGLAALPAYTDGALFLLGDQPFVDRNIINKLIFAFQKQQSSLTIPTYRGKLGNPVLAHHNIFEMLRELDGDTGARVLFDKLSDRRQEVDVGDPGIHLDADTIEDYHKLIYISESNRIK